MKNFPIYIGASMLGTMGITFLILKLTGVISWHWVWVTAPFWIPLCFAIVVLILFVLIIKLSTKK